MSLKTFFNQGKVRDLFYFLTLAPSRTIKRTLSTSWSIKFGIQFLLNSSLRKTVICLRLSHGSHILFVLSVCKKLTDLHTQKLYAFVLT